ncbi:hypothetical protein ACFL6C_07170 [Myxococcota bacterium]
MAKIEAAKKAISDAENELLTVTDSVVAPPAKEEVSEVVQVALLRVKAAKAKLIDLERLVALAKIEAAKIEAAKTAIGDAEKDLNRVLDEIIVAEPVQKTLVTKVVQDAFTKMRAAKRRLVDLENSIANDKN